MFRQQTITKMDMQQSSILDQKITQDFKINTYETLNRAGTSGDYRFLYNIKDVDSNALDMFLLKESKVGNIDHIKLLLKNGVNIHTMML